MSVRGRHADLWTRAALNPPRAHGAPLPKAQFKTLPDDFRVEEQLSFVPSGSGPHWLLRVEKKNANTRWVAAEIARLAQVPADAVGYAGLKDRHAVRSVVRELAVEADAGTITLSFMLARGQFATSVLREICELESTPALESDDE